jgi:hypothetical protein
VLTTLLASRSRQCRAIPLLHHEAFESVTGYLYLIHWRNLQRYTKHTLFSPRYTILFKFRCRNKHDILCITNYPTLTSFNTGIRLNKNGGVLPKHVAANKRLYFYVKMCKCRIYKMTNLAKFVFRIPTRPDRPWGTPSLLYFEYQVFTGGKAAEVKGTVKLYIYPLWATVACSR